MSEEFENAPRTYSGALLAVIAAALICALGGLIWSYVLSGRVATQKTELDEATQQNKQLAARLRETDARLNVATEELGKSLGLTQKQMDTRAQEIIRREQAVEANTQQLATQQKQTAQQVSAVSSAVSDVKTDVGGVKTDVAKTQSDLASAVAQLTSMKGDVSDHSSLIARNHDEPVGTVSLELKKADPKKNTFSLDVISDDKTVPKNNKGLYEPLQFYSGKEPMLFEIVVNSVSAKNTVKGYLSAPKSAPVPPTGQ